MLENLKSRRWPLAPVGWSLALALAACTAHSGQEFSVSNASQIRSGVTTKTSVQQNLGEPYRRDITADGKETWYYTYDTTTTSPGATAFIPFIGPALSGSQKASSKSQEVTIVFAGDVVASCKLRLSSSSVSGALGAGGGALNVAEAQAGGGAGTTQETNCGDTPIR